MMLYETRFLIALLFTYLIEVPVAYVLMRFLFKVKDRFRILTVAVLTSLVTLPYLWFVLPPYVDARLYVVSGEFLVVISEALLICMLLKLRLDKAFFVSLVANSASYFFGVLFL